MEGDRFEREDRFARLVRGLDRALETLRGGCRAKVTGGVYLNGLWARAKFFRYPNLLC